VWSARYSFFRFDRLRCADDNGAAITLNDTAMVSEGRLFWLSPLEWSVLLVSIALCGYFALLVLRVR
jgi:hypothetical protein